MTNRFIAGLRNGEMGVWLSKADVDVMAANEQDLLISPDFKNLSFLIRGTVFVPYDTQQTVYFPEPAASPPAIWGTAINGSYYLWPQTSYSYSSGLGNRFRITSHTDRMVVQNVEAFGNVSDLYFRYFVIGYGADP